MKLISLVNCLTISIFLKYSGFILNVNILQYIGIFNTYLVVNILSKILRPEEFQRIKNNNIFFRIWYFIPLFILGLSFCNTKNTHRLTIAAAANVQFAMDTLVDLFELETGIPTYIITGSSGKLTAQILQGAPYDVFLSADMKYPELIYKSGKAFKAPVVYAHGSLILWTLKEDIQPDIGILTSDKIIRIAIANPKTAPYGAASIEFLKGMNIYEKVKDKLIFGESISQVNQFITSKSADIGFSSESVVLSSVLPDTGQWIRLDNTKYAPLRQGMVIINREKGKTIEAEEFFSFLLSQQAKNILFEFGYKTQFPE